MKKISYYSLQKKYAGKIVALDRAEKKILAVGREALGVVKKLQRQRIDGRDYVLVGPVQKAGTISVYVHFPLRDQED